MRISIAAVCLIIGGGFASAQTTPPANPGTESTNTTGRTVIPEKKGPDQPQGPTGPLNTKSGGAPAASPQGETPPGMQSAPGGSSKSVTDPK
jgi:hypothetical protein